MDRSEREPIRQSSTERGDSSRTPSRRLRWARRSGPLVLATLTLSSCSLLPYGGASSKARLVHSLYIKTAIVALIVLIGVIATIIVELIVFRRRRGDDSLPKQDHGRPAIYGSFFLIGLVLVAVLFPFSESTLSKVDDIAAQPDLNVTITGSQWQWAASYEKQGFSVSGQTNKDAMEWELPVDKTVRIDLKSTDVMHGFYLPQFNYSKNAVPGITNSFSFTPDRLGTFPGQCTQLCGVAHYQMKFVLKVVTSSQFAVWVRDEQSEAHAAKCPPPQGSITLIAHNVGWSTDCIGVPANQPFTVTMKNLDNGVQHNFSIYTHPDAKQSLFKGPVFAGPATKVLNIPSLRPGTYYFQCDIHGKAMSGTIIAGAQENETEPATGVRFKLSAKNVQWSASKIVVPAGKRITITFENEDAGITHNFSIYTDPAADKRLYKGPLTTGVSVTVLHVPALRAGLYYFQCDVHGQAMSGTYLVTG